jgi:hypothetical protein
MTLQHTQKVPETQALIPDLRDDPPILHGASILEPLSISISIG